MCPFSLGHAYLTPAGGPVHAMSDFADPTFDHVSNNTHVNDDSILEIILDSIQIISIQLLHCQSQLFADQSLQTHTCLGCTTNTSLVKELKPLSWLEDRQWYRDLQVRQGG